MHMADALISPAIGGTFWVVSASTLAFASNRLGKQAQSPAAPLMGVMGAFVFAAQMINFSIPGTGSSGHLAGGLLLSVLLGPHAAFITMASILTVQCLFFADGGLLALGCNLFNMGFLSCYVAYPLIFKPLAGNSPSGGKLTLACVTASVLGLAMGAACVVAQTTLSGISDLPVGPFAALMLPIHLAIGLVEGLVTAGVLSFVRRAEPELLAGDHHAAKPLGTHGKTVAGLAVVALLVAGGLSWFASSDPDGLEWSMKGLTGKTEIEAPESGMHSTAAKIQESTTVMPDYAFKAEKKEAPTEHNGAAAEQTMAPAEEAKPWPDPSAATSLAGVAGGGITLALAAGIGMLAGRRKLKREE
ncbi:energy-coupling factor ABC transporter permease [Fundidesulfovibrio butyratiphilus]